MAEFNLHETDQYGQQGNAGFFGLENDGDIATVRFLYGTVDEFKGYSVHDIEVNGLKRYIDCPRTPQDDIDVCPLCASGRRSYVKFFINLIDEATGDIKVWDRGKTFQSKIVELFNKYSSTDVPLVSNVFDIERVGAKGDPNTKYEVYHVDADDSILEDFGTPGPVYDTGEGGIILVKTYEEVEYYLDHGNFPGEEPRGRGGRGRGGRDVERDSRAGRGRQASPPPRQRTASVPQQRRRPVPTQDEYYEAPQQQTRQRRRPTNNVEDTF